MLTVLCYNFIAVFCNFLLFLFAIELCCATPDEEILHSSPGVTWYLRSNLLQSTAPYGPGLHIFVLRPEKAFLQSDIMQEGASIYHDYRTKTFMQSDSALVRIYNDCGTEESQSYLMMSDTIRATAFIKALHKNENGFEKQVDVVYQLTKSQHALTEDCLKLSISIHAPKTVKKMVFIIESMTKSDKPLSVTTDSSRQILSYPLPYPKDDASCPYIRVTALYDGSLDIDHITSKGNGSQPEEHCSFFQSMTKSDKPLSVTTDPSRQILSYPLPYPKDDASCPYTRVTALYDGSLDIDHITSKGNGSQPEEHCSSFQGCNTAQEPDTSAWDDDDVTMKNPQRCYWNHQGQKKNDSNILTKLARLLRINSKK